MIEIELKKEKKLPRYPVLVTTEDVKPIDFILVSSYKEAEKLAKILSFGKKFVLFHPQPVTVPKEFWKRENKSNRLKLSKEFELLKDKSIKVIKHLILDVDSPFVEVSPVWLELKKKFSSLDGDIYKTKSGRFRAIIKLKTPLKPFKKLKNGRTNYENVKEVLNFFKKEFEKRKLNFDQTCIDRLNHPIWVGRGEELILDGEEVDFYSLYREVKKAEKESRTKSKSRKTSLKRQHISSTAQKVGENDINPLPTQKKVNRNEICKRENIVSGSAIHTANWNRIRHSYLAWNLFVESLGKKYPEKRFFKVIVPTVAVAKTLNIPLDTAVNKLKVVLAGRNPKKNSHDFKVVESFEKSAYLPFPDKEKLLLQTVRKIAEKKELTRKELIKLCYNQRWLADEIVEDLVSTKLCKVEFKKLTPGRGRKSKVISFTITVENYLKAIKPLPKKYQELLMKVSQNVFNNQETKKNFFEKKRLIKCSSPPERGYIPSVRKEEESRVEVENFSSTVKEVKETSSMTAAESVLRFLKLVEELEKKGEYQKLSEIFAEAEMFEVDLTEVNRVYFKDRELGRLLGKAVFLRVVEDDYVSRRAVVKLTPIQREFAEKYVKLEKV